MQKSDYEKARKRKIESLDDLDSTVVRRIKFYLYNHSARATAERFNVPLEIVTEIASHIGR